MTDELGRPAADGARLDITDVSVSFGDVDVLEDVFLSIEPGEFVGLVGPNGAGKTTMLRTMSGALEPTRGAVTVDETSLHGRPSKAASRLVAVVPQDTILSFSFDARTVVEMGRYPHRSRFSPPDEEDRTAVERALERTRTSDLADSRIDEVSGGERQRVLLARALAQETPVLLLDEPTASLDVNHQIETLELVADLVAEGRTAVAAIHDLDLAARYCDRLVILADGTVCADGAPREVLTPAALESAFDATATVTANPVTGTATVTTLPDSREIDVPRRVHVLGTGPIASAVLSRLSAAGIDASAGPVSRGDAAASTARELGLECVTVEPFAAVSREAREATVARLEAAEAVVLADLEIATGNQLLLETLSDVDALVAVESRPFEERNFAGEAARRRYEACRERALEAEPAGVLEAVAAAARTSGAGERDPHLESTED